MKYVGVDLHKQIIVLCVVRIVSGQRHVLARRKFACRDVAALDEFLASLGCFQLAVEATSAYSWLLQRVERIADRIVLVHPRKMRIIAERPTDWRFISPARIKFEPDGVKTSRDPPLKTSLSPSPLWTFG